MNLYYPIGTIVKLDISDSAYFMIAGYLPKREDSNVFDYFAVPFPFGLVDERSYICFNRDSITEIVYKSFFDEQCEEVLNGFSEFVTNLNNTAGDTKKQ